MPGIGRRTSSHCTRPGEPEHREQRADQAERDRHRDRRDHRPIRAEDLDAERQRDQERQEDAEDAHHLLDRGGGGGFDGLAAEARGVVELVAVETRGAGQEGADEAADQERPEDVAERELDALAAQQHQPAVHRRENADELDARREPAEEEEGARIDQRDLRDDQPPGCDVGGVLRNLAGEMQRLDLVRIHRNLVIEQQPEGAHRHPGLQHVEDAPPPRLRREARNQDRENRDDQDLEKNQHPDTSMEGGGRHGTPEVGPKEARQVTVPCELRPIDFASILQRGVERNVARGFPAVEDPMRYRSICWLLAAALLALAPIARAAGPDLKPGLWERTVTMQRPAARDSGHARTR